MANTYTLNRFGSRQHLFYYECLACKKSLHRNGSWGSTWNFDDRTCQSKNLIFFCLVALDSVIHQLISHKYENDSLSLSPLSLLSLRV